MVRAAEDHVLGSEPVSTKHQAALRETRTPDQQSDSKALLTGL